MEQGGRCSRQGTARAEEELAGEQGAAGTAGPGATEELRAYVNTYVTGMHMLRRTVCGNDRHRRRPIQRLRADGECWGWGGSVEGGQSCGGRTASGPGGGRCTAPPLVEGWDGATSSQGRFGGSV